MNLWRDLPKVCDVILGEVWGKATTWCGAFEVIIETWDCQIHHHSLGENGHTDCWRVVEQKVSRGLRCRQDANEEN